MRKIALLFFFSLFVLLSKAQIFNVTAVVKSSSSIEVSWDDMGVESYFVYKLSSPDEYPINSVEVTGTIYLSTDLEPNTCYFYRVGYNSGEFFPISDDYAEGCTGDDEPGPTPVGFPDIKGEASIDIIEGQLTLVNYEKKYLIPADEPFVLYSSSYIYLTIHTSDYIPLKNIDVAGDLHIHIIGGKTAAITIASDIDNEPDASIKAGRLEILGPGTLSVNDHSQGRKYGLLLDNSLTVDGRHSLLFHNPFSSYGIKAGSYIKVSNGADLKVSSDSIGIYSNAHIMVENAATIEAHALDENGYGILLEGNHTGIYLFAGNNATGDKIDMQVSSSLGTAIKIDGNGNIIAQGNYVSQSEGWTAQINAEGITGGIYLTGSGYIKADGALIRGVRDGAEGEISAVHAPRNLYSLNQGQFEEVYLNANLQITEGPYNITNENPAIGNNMLDLNTYDWSSEPADRIIIVPGGLQGKVNDSGINIIAERTNNIVNSEYTKVDDKSIHRIILNDNSLSDEVRLEVYWFSAESNLTNIEDYKGDLKRFVFENSHYQASFNEYTVNYGDEIVATDYYEDYSDHNNYLPDSYPSATFYADRGVNYLVFIMKNKN